MQERVEFYRANFNPAFLQRAKARQKEAEAERRRKEREAEIERNARAQEARQEEAARIRQARKDALQELANIAAERDRVLAELEALQEVRRKVDMRTIISRICRATGVSWSEVSSVRREERIVLARQAICYWSARLTSLSYPQIARRLERDHTTVIHACRTYRKKRAKQGRNLRPARG